jgi:hypothetical protein
MQLKRVARHQCGEPVEGDGQEFRIVVVRAWRQKSLPHLRPVTIDCPAMRERAYTLWHMPFSLKVTYVSGQVGLPTRRRCCSGVDGHQDPTAPQP